MPIDVFWQTGAPPKGLWLPDQGVAAYRDDRLAGPAPQARAEAGDARRAARRHPRRSAEARFDAVGFAPATLDPGARALRLGRLMQFVDDGWQGDMGWMASAPTSAPIRQPCGPRRRPSCRSPSTTRRRAIRWPF